MDKSQLPEFSNPDWTPAKPFAELFGGVEEMRYNLLQVLKNSDHPLAQVIYQKPELFDSETFASATPGIGVDDVLQARLTPLQVETMIALLREKDEGAEIKPDGSVMPEEGEATIMAVLHALDEMDDYISQERRIAG